MLYYANTYITCNDEIIVPRGSYFYVTSIRTVEMELIEITLVFKDIVFITHANERWFHTMMKKIGDYRLDNKLVKLVIE